MLEITLNKNKEYYSCNLSSEIAKGTFSLIRGTVLIVTKKEDPKEVLCVFKAFCRYPSLQLLAYAGDGIGKNTILETKFSISAPLPDDNESHLEKITIASKNVFSYFLNMPTTLTDLMNDFLFSETIPKKRKSTEEEQETSINNYFLSLLSK